MAYISPRVSSIPLPLCKLNVHCLFYGFAKMTLISEGLKIKNAYKKFSYFLQLRYGNPKLKNPCAELNGAYLGS